MKRISWLAAVCMLSTTVQAQGEPESCRKVSFADIGWTDTAVVTSTTRYLLDALGYETGIERLSVQDTFKRMEAGTLDVLMGNWMPSQAADIKDYQDRGAVDVVRANLASARYTLAVPTYVYDAGVKDVADLAAQGDKFGRLIYSIANSGGATRVEKILGDDTLGLKGFRQEQSSEGLMLASVERKMRLKEWVVFLAWEPHPMNIKLDFRYLSGGDAYFGPNSGSATVYTVARKPLRKTCPNVGRLLENLSFTIPMESEMMDQVLNAKVNPRRASREWLKRHPEVLSGWLRGVTTVTGEPAQAVVEASLKR